MAQPGGALVDVQILIVLLRVENAAEYVPIYHLLPKRTLLVIIQKNDASDANSHRNLWSPISSNKTKQYY